ncbi:MAG: hypothetical protein IKD59_05515 [Lachnospiraceae bacterium]|nr:hypothetical protein [Lachnospiraceae bacterium]
MRLIDADAFLERIKKDPLFPLVERYGLSGVIENEPTVDAVPVVRCKDCIHKPIGDPNEHDVQPHKEDDYKCPCLCEDDGWYSWIPADDWFCGNGETE